MCVNQFTYYMRLPGFNCSAHLLLYRTAGKTIRSWIGLSLFCSQEEEAEMYLAAIREQVSVISISILNVIFYASTRLIILKYASAASLPHSADLCRMVRSW